MVEHAIRDHSMWSASSTERNWNCSGALALTAHLPETSSEAADWGTACHELSEICIREGKQPDDFIGTKRRGKIHTFEVDDEMAETAAMYVDYVRQQAIAAAPKSVNPASLIHVEQRFTLNSLNTPFDAGGTADCVIHFPAEKVLEVIDLKGGRGHVVEVIGNPQLRTYALGAMLANGDLKVDLVKVTIVQPRAPHKSGRIRSEVFHVADLIEWTVDMLHRMQRAKDATLDRNSMNQTLWEKEYLAAGDHCKFCKAAGFCPALERKAMDTVGLWFNDLDEPQITNSPDMLSPERAVQILDAADMIGDWINAVRAYWHAQAEGGVDLGAWILVNKQAREKWIDDEAETKAAAIALRAGVEREKVYNEPKIRTPKQVRDALAKAKRQDAIDEIKALSDAKSSGTNLVRADKTTRAPATPAVHKHFSILD